MSKVLGGNFNRENLATRQASLDGNAAVDLRRFEQEPPPVEEISSYTLATGNQRFIALMIDATFTGVTNKVITSALVYFSHSGKQAGWMAVVTAVLQLYYFIFSEYLNGQTFGKKIMKIKVVNTDGGELTFGQIVYREIIGRTCSAIPIGLGYIGAWRREDRKTFHDRMAKTSVIKVG